MKQSHNQTLYDEVFLQIARMHDEVDFRKRLNEYHGQSGRRKDYPAITVGAEFYAMQAVAHHRIRSASTDFHPLVYKELTNRLGELNEYGSNYPCCGNKVGHCAENYAATGVLKKIDPEEQLDNSNVLSKLSFTKAFRPRTWKNVDWCENCHTMFD